MEEGGVERWEGEWGVSLVGRKERVVYGTEVWEDGRGEGVRRFR